MDNLIEFKASTNSSTYNAEDEAIFKMIDFMENISHNIVNVFPFIVKNGLSFSDIKIPKHWELSMRHIKDVKDIVSNYYKNLKQFSGNESFINIIKNTPEIKNKIDGIEINGLEDLISVCEDKKEVKIKYELENNLRLVSFKNQKIEISFNSNLEKSFVKELSAKLLEWTNKRWIIAFSKEDGLPTIKEQKKKLNENLLKKELETQFSKEVRKIFADAELVKVEEEK